MAYTPLHLFKLPPKPRAALYIDDSNLYHLGKASGWMVDYKKLYKWVSALNTIVYARVYMGIPKHEPARSIATTMRTYLESKGFIVVTKELKRITDSSDPKGFRNKCNFDVEIHDDVMKELKDVDIVYVASADSDFLRTKDNILKEQKHVKFLAYDYHCASEIKFSSWFISLDSIKDEVARGEKRKNQAQGLAN
jgi:NYN domain